MRLYKLIMVDDEEDVRGSIERKVDWNSLGFELVGSVSNGEEALELVDQMQVDVVMTDIKMPFMDGLTLSAKVKENYKNTKVVLYSGFDDFEFAREAIHLEVEEYLLKPISSKDLENVFRKLKDSLDKEFAERRNFESLYAYYQKSIPMMRDQLMAGILEGKIDGAQAEQMLCSYDLDFQAPYYCVGILDGEMRDNVKEFQAEQMLKLSLLNLVKEYFQDNMESYIFMYLGYVVIIVQLQEERDVHQFIYHMNQVCKMGTRILGMDVDAGVGNVCTQFLQIALSYEASKNALNYRVLGEESGRALYINDVEPASQEMLFMEIQGISQIIHDIKFGTEEGLNSSIEEFMKELHVDNKATIQQSQLILLELMTEMMKLLRGYQIEMSEVFGKNFSPYQKLGSFSTIVEMSEWLRETCMGIWHMIRKRRTNSTNVMTEKAKQYIDEHYSQSDLSVEDICNYLNVSATHFSVMFKKEIGMSFVAYLTKVRLEHALELLNNTEDKSYIIAEKVGYTEANYFSYVFKKQYGVSPSKYRLSKEN